MVARGFLDYSMDSRLLDMLGKQGLCILMGRLLQIERDEVRAMGLLLLVDGTDPTLPGESGGVLFARCTIAGPQVTAWIAVHGSSVCA
jgi:hypothetical protein